MTDEQIIFNLECCANSNCFDCSFNCLDEMPKFSLKLIKKQQAEIDRLKMLFNDQQEIIADLEWTVENEGFKHLGKMYSELRAEAIKEFAEKLKAKAHTAPVSWYEMYMTVEKIVTVEDIDNLVKEMGCGECVLLSQSVGYREYNIKMESDSYCIYGERKEDD